ncbi:MAG: NADH:flavin oxidoreductase [Desulfobacterium sp.]|nr:NADH:flavin oxidoreductase [Desulfobacterium sp.]
MSYDALFEPITIGNMELKNRLAVAPMNVGYSAPDGYPSDHYLAHYATRARGGFGLITTTAAMVNPYDWAGSEGMNPLKFTDYRYYRFWSEIIKAIHYYDCKMAIQLSPGWGRQGHPNVGRPDVPAAAPSCVPLCMDLRDYFKKSKGNITQLSKRVPGALEAMDIDRLINMTDEEYFSEDFQQFLQDTLSKMNPETYHFIWGDVPRELTIPEIKDLEDRMAVQAKDAFNLEFDAVEIHSPHGYLIHQFLSPKMNKRHDEYGGSLENRARFLINIIKKIREKVGPDKPVWCRLSGDELQPGGISHDEQCQVAAMVKDAGVNAINVSQGSYEAMGSAFAPDGEGDFTRWAAGFKKATNGLPILVPNFLTPACAEKAIKEQSVDIIQLGRQSLADPFWPVKVKTGREKEIIKCIRCQQCFSEFGASHFLECAVNPVTGREKYFPELWLAGTKFGDRLKKALKKMEGFPQI